MPGGFAEGRGAGDGGVVGVEEAVELGAAGAEFCGHSAFGLLLAGHFLLELPGEDALDGGGFDFAPVAFVIEEVVECGAAVWVESELGHGWFPRLRLF